MEKFRIMWNRYDEKFKCIIGYLTYDQSWQFYYDDEGYGIASRIGFVPFPEFSNPYQIYQSETLFKTFSSRIRHSENLTETNKIEMLDLTNGILATDNISIVKEPTKERQKTYGTN